MREEQSCIGLTGGAGHSLWLVLFLVLLPFFCDEMILGVGMNSVCAALPVLRAVLWRLPVPLWLCFVSLLTALGRTMMYHWI